MDKVSGFLGGLLALSSNAGQRLSSTSPLTVEEMNNLFEPLFRDVLFPALSPKEVAYFSMTCKTLYGLSFGAGPKFVTELKPDESFSEPLYFTHPAQQYALVHYITTNETVRKNLDQHGVGEYALQLLKEMKIPFGIAQKLMNNLLEYKKQAPGSQEEWIKGQCAADDKTFKQYFYPACLAWPIFSEGEHQIKIDLELALLLNSEGMNLYKEEKDNFQLLKDFCTHIKFISTKSNISFKHGLKLLSHPVIQYHLSGAESPAIRNRWIITLFDADFQKCFPWRYNPVIKKFYNKGVFNGDEAIVHFFNLFFFKQIDMRSYWIVLNSPKVCAAYENGDISDYGIVDLATMYSYIKEHADFYLNKYHEYLTEENELTCAQLLRLSNDDVLVINQDWVKSDINSGDLTYADVLGKSAKFLIMQTAHTMRQLLFQSGS